MKPLLFHWHGAETCEPLRICISDRLSPLLPHAHGELEIMFFYRSAGGEYLCDGERMPFAAADTLIVNPWEIHSCDDFGVGGMAACIIADVGMLSVPSVRHVRFSHRVAEPRLDASFRRLLSVLSDGGLHACERECAVYGIFYEILAVLSKHSRCLSQGAEGRGIGGILKYMEDNLCENLTLAALAKEFHLSKDRFYHVFKGATGFGPMQYIARQRIKRSCALLKDSDMSVQEIAEECRFCTSSYFSKKFSEYMHVSPHEYRKRMRSGETVSFLPQ